jgi:hypothetical protein
MRKLLGACAVCAVAVGTVAVPSALGVKSAKQVGGTVTVSGTPTTITPTTTSVAASGNVSSNSSCRKGRIVHLAYVENGVPGAEVGSALTGPNGDFTATLPNPTVANPTAGGTVVIRATVDPATRTVGGKKKSRRTKKGRQFNCLQLTGDSGPITVPPPTVSSTPTV